jgi:hypothetical protein
MEPLKVLVALAWGVLLGAASLSVADRLFPQPVSVSPAIVTLAEPERQGGCSPGRAQCSDGTLSPSCECDGATEAADRVMRRTTADLPFLPAQEAPGPAAPPSRTRIGHFPAL